MPRIRLITRADDLGSFSGVAPAVVDAHRRGITRNASIMVPAPFFEEAAGALRSAPSLCVGVHLTICCEWSDQRWRPVSTPDRVPTLVDGDGFIKRDPGRIHGDGVRMSEIFRECQAQLDRARAHGLDVRYVDTHMGWEWMHEPAGPPRVIDLMPAWAARNGVRWYGSIGARGLPGLPHGSPPPSSPRAALIAQLESAPAGTYVQVTHPCWPSSGIAAADLGGGAGRVASERLADYELIADRSLRDEFARRGVETIRYDEA